MDGRQQEMELHHCTETEVQGHEETAQGHMRANTVRFRIKSDSSFCPVLVVLWTCRAMTSMHCGLDSTGLENDIQVPCYREKMPKAWCAFAVLSWEKAISGFPGIWPEWKGLPGHRIAGVQTRPEAGRCYGAGFLQHRSPFRLIINNPILISQCGYY